MSRLVDILRTLETIDHEQQALDLRKQALTRQAWIASGQTISRARQLITDATLSLLTQGRAIDAASLGLEVSRLAGDRDRFAVDLCDDWLNTAMESFESENPPIDGDNADTH
jgi:hypothetical protein